MTLADLPSFRSMVRRLGWDADFNETMPDVAWRALLGELVQRAGRASVPWYAKQVAERWLAAAVPGESASSGKEEVTAAAGGVGLDDRSGERGGRSSLDLRKTASFVWGIVVIFVCAAGSARARHRVLMATLAASGFCWGVLARGSVPFFDFEGMFLVGLPLVFFSIVLLRARRISGRSIGVCAGAAVLIFVLSGLQMMERLRLDAEPGSRAEVADYERIRAAVPEGGVIASPSPRIDRARFFLPGRIFVEYGNGRQRHRADFVLMKRRIPGGAGLLTPDNRRVFLYDRAAYHAQYATLGDPRLEGGRGWRVHLVGDRLLYTTGEACGTKGRFRNEPRFFLEVLDDRGRSRGRRDFGFQYRMFEVAGRCMAEVYIPGYDAAARVRTGQFVPGEGPLWSEEVPLPGCARASS